MAKKIYTKLPGSLQTTAIKNFFEGTVEQLFSKANVDQIQGFIGNRTGEDLNFDGTFIQEPTYTKQAYALTPAVNTINETTGKSENLIFYDELIDTLKTYGVNTADHNKIFSEKYASFLPPINIDKFVNYQEYYWYPRGPSAIVIEPTVDTYIDVDRDIIGKAHYTPANGKPFRNGMVVVFKGNYVIKADGFYTTLPAIDATDIVLGKDYKISSLGATDWNAISDFSEGARSFMLFNATAKGNGNGTVEPVEYTEYVVTGVGQSIQLVEKNSNFNARYTTVDYNSNSIDFVYKNKGTVENLPSYNAVQQPADFDDVGIPTVHIKGESIPGATREVQNVVVGTLAQYAGDTIISDGTNSVTLDHSVTQPRTAVELVEQIRSAPGYSDLAFTVEVATRMPKDYIIQERGALNNNHWSRINFWFHRQNFQDAGDSFPNVEFRAQRPIIEFDKTLEMFNHGVVDAGCVDADAFNITYSQADGMSLNEYVDNVLTDDYERIIFSNEVTDTAKYIYSLKKVTADQAVKAVLFDNSTTVTLDATFTLSNKGRNSEIVSITLNTNPVVADAANAYVEIQGLHSMDAVVDVSIDGSNVLQSLEVSNGGKGWYLDNQRRLEQIAHPILNTIDSMPGDATFVPLIANVNDVVHVKTGESQVGKALVWNGNSWQDAQEKSLPNQAPLFKLYDTDGEYLGDPGVYPNSTFKGNKIFGYATEVPETDTNVVKSTVIDSELGHKLIYKLFNAQSEIVFENFIETAQYTFTPVGPSSLDIGVTDGATNLNGPYAIDGYYPLFTRRELAEQRGNGTAHEHVFYGKTFYMPSGLELGVTYFHGNYNGQLSPDFETINTTSTVTSATPYTGTVGGSSY